MPGQTGGEADRELAGTPRGFGLVQVYTGDGKGKTTAALGLALRASGHGFRAAFLQFLKGNRRCGEHRFLERYPGFVIIQPGSRSIFRQEEDERRETAREALAAAIELVAGDSYDLLVLDEVLTALKAGLIETRQVLELIDRKSPGLELVLTGRGAPPELIAAADLVTEMVPHKHPFKKGVRARRGVEY